MALCRLRGKCFVFIYVFVIFLKVKGVDCQVNALLCSCYLSQSQRCRMLGTVSLSSQGSSVLSQKFEFQVFNNVICFDQLTYYAEYK